MIDPLVIAAPGSIVVAVGECLGRKDVVAASKKTNYTLLVTIRLVH
jgi:hypothetical protein